jgi:hypothetical protein
LEECSTSIVRVTRISELGTKLAVTSNWSTLTDSCHPDDGGATFLWNVGSYKPHGITSQKMAFFTYILVSKCCLYLLRLARWPVQNTLFVNFLFIFECICTWIRQQVIMKPHYHHLLQIKIWKQVKVITVKKYLSKMTFRTPSIYTSKLFLPWLAEFIHSQKLCPRILKTWFYRHGWI